jgi:hypothetical protein
MKSECPLLAQIGYPCALQMSAFGGNADMPVALLGYRGGLVIR